MERSSRSVAQMNLADDVCIDMSPQPKSRISEDKKAEIRSICESRFGSEFMKERSAECEHENFSTILEMLRRNEFASVEEVKGEAVRFLDAQVRWIQNPSNDISRDQRKEMIVMAEHLKQKFVNLADNESSNVQSAEIVIVEQLFEIFPQLDHLELHRRVNLYLGQSGNKIDIAFAVNEISQEIFTSVT